MPQIVEALAEVEFPAEESGPEGRTLAADVGPILVAVDLSGDSRQALLWACDYAEKSGAPVQILHVLHDPAEAPGKYSRNNGADTLAPMMDTAERMLAAFMTDVRADHIGLESLATAETKIVEGLPAPTIVEVAKRIGARMVVVGSRGHSGLPKLMFGSNSQRVAQLSPVPVTVVKSKS